MKARIEKLRSQRREIDEQIHKLEREVKLIESCAKISRPVRSPSPKQAASAREPRESNSPFDSPADFDFPLVLSVSPKERIWNGDWVEA